MAPVGNRTQNPSGRHGSRRLGLPQVALQNVGLAGRKWRGLRGYFSRTYRLRLACGADFPRWNFRNHPRSGPGSNPIWTAASLWLTAVCGKQQRDTPVATGLGNGSRETTLFMTISFSRRIPRIISLGLPMVSGRSRTDYPTPYRVGWVRCPHSNRNGYLPGSRCVSP